MAASTSSALHLLHELPAMPTLRAPLRDIAESSLVSRWRGRVPEQDVQFALRSGMSALDVNLLRTYSAGHFLLIVRCPKRAGMLFQGVLPPKGQGDKAKTSEISGALVTGDGRLLVSDYDLMSVWQGRGDGWVRIFCPGPTAQTVYWGTPEAQRMMTALLPRMQSPFDHGCQDDYLSAKNPGVGATQRFAAFYNGTARYLASGEALKAFYAEQRIEYPYDDEGSYVGPVR
jgi:hypothetical protein